MAKFIKACECPNCGTLCKDDGITVDFTTDNMVVSLQNFSTTEWHCDSCGIDFGTCEVENIIEEFQQVANENYITEWCD